MSHPHNSDGHHHENDELSSVTHFLSPRHSHQYIFKASLLLLWATWIRRKVLSQFSFVFLPPPPPLPIKMLISSSLPCFSLYSNQFKPIPVAWRMRKRTTKKKKNRNKILWLLFEFRMKKIHPAFLLLGRRGCCWGRKCGDLTTATTIFHSYPTVWIQMSLCQFLNDFWSRNRKLKHRWWNYFYVYIYMNVKRERKEKKRRRGKKRGNVNSQKKKKSY